MVIHIQMHKEMFTSNNAATDWVHNGQVVLRSNQATRHDRWYWCPHAQGRWVSTSPGAKSAKHTYTCICK
jgi:hypothetical protein